uniref:Uncharacterized protein n=1 Tax=Ditylenchus dipsaci TaxID=166011 RepID=A0A915ELV3_9BILA
MVKQKQGNIGDPPPPLSRPQSLLSKQGREQVTQLNKEVDNTRTLEIQQQQQPSVMVTASLQPESCSSSNQPVLLQHLDCLFA